MLIYAVFIKMQYVKEKVKDSSLMLDAARRADLWDACNLLRCDHKGVKSIEDLYTKIGIDPIHTLIGYADPILDNSFLDLHFSVQF